MHTLNTPFNPATFMSGIIHQLNPYIRQIKAYTSHGAPVGYMDPDYSFTLIKRGGGQFTLHGETYKIQRGDLLFFPPYLYHHIQPDSPIEQLIIHFDPVYNADQEGLTIYHKRRYSSHPDYLAQKGTSIDTALAQLPLVITPDYQRFEQLYERFQHLANRQTSRLPESQFAGKAMIFDLLDTFLSYQPQLPTRRQFDLKQWQQLEQAVNYMHQNLNQRITLNDCAKHSHLSPTYFSRIFHEYIGQSFQTYLIAIRLERAKELILDGEMNFSQMAEACGFANLAHFSRAFKQYEGCSPTTYQKSVHF